MSSMTYSSFAPSVAAPKPNPPNVRSRVPVQVKMASHQAKLNPLPDVLAARCGVLPAQA